MIYSRRLWSDDYESAIREGIEVKQNRFFVEGAYKYNYNNGILAMSDHKAAATNFLNALDRIPKMMEQFKTQNEAIEKDLPTLLEIVGGTWKKEDELKELKSELSALERKIQLELAPPDKSEQISDNTNEQKQDTTISSTVTGVNNQFAKEHIIVARPKPATTEAKSFRL